ncbi:DUF3566 domain-containing protein [Modestobacter sp. SYSU DS0511]
MSDRTRSSVRADSREETGTTDAGTPPEAGSGAVGDGATAAAGASGAGSDRPGFDDSARRGATGAGSGRSGSARAETARPAAGRTATPTDPPPVDATQAVTLPPTGATPPRAARPAGAPTDGGPGGAAGTARANGKSRGPRRARLQLRHIDTWSALKISLVVSIALFFVWMVAVGILYGVLGGLDVFDTLNDVFSQLRTSDEGGGDVITAGVVFGGAAVIGAINVVLLTALCTVAAFVYNLCSDLVGGLEVTLAERD